MSTTDVRPDVAAADAVHRHHDALLSQLDARVEALRDADDSRSTA